MSARAGRTSRQLQALATDKPFGTIAPDVRWLVRSRSPETTLGPRRWLDALPGNPTTARNTTLLERLAKL